MPNSATLVQALGAAFCAILCALSSLGGGGMRMAQHVAAWAKSGYTAKDYVQDGLVAMWDGIENAGWGVHDPNATTWKDVVGTDKITYVGSYEVTSKGVYIGAYSYGISDQARSYENYTLHLNADMYSLAGNSTDVFSYQRSDINLSGFGHPIYIGDSGSTYAGLNVKTGRFDGVLDAVVEWDGSSAIISTYKNGVYAGLVSSSRSSDDVCVILNSLRTRINNSSRRIFRSIAIYDRLLTAAEIAANYAIDKARFNLT